MCHVLIIEDDWLLSDYVSQLVEAAGASSIDMVAGEDDAVAAARRNPPDVIISDVTLIQGRGPIAVQRIVDELGPRAVMYVTGTPELCHPCPPEAPLLVKPVSDAVLTAAFRSLAQL